MLWCMLKSCTSDARTSTVIFVTNFAETLCVGIQSFSIAFIKILESRGYFPFYKYPEFKERF